MRPRKLEGNVIRLTMVSVKQLRDEFEEHKEEKDSELVTCVRTSTETQRTTGPTGAETILPRLDEVPELEKAEGASLEVRGLLRRQSRSV